MSSPSPVISATTEAKKTTPSGDVSVGLMSGGTGVVMSISLSLIFAIIFSYGAAKLSYDTFHSVGWAVLAFFFSGFYYPYYALFVNRTGSMSVPPPMAMTGARRR